MADNRELQILLTLKDKASGDLQKFNSVLEKNAATFRKVGLGLTAVGGGMTLLTKQFIDVAANFEQTQISFTTMLGSAEKASELLKELAQFAAKTPFELKDVETGAKSLMAFGIPLEKIIPTLKSLGDVSAGLSVPMERLILNFGQVAAQGKLTGRELRDFAIAGVPLLDELANMMGKTKAEITEMVSAGQIGFPEVEEVFKRMSSEGGRFANLMDEQSKSFSGMMSNLRDQIDLFLREGGQPLIEAGKEILSKLISIVQALNDWAKAHPELAKNLAIAIAVIGGLLTVLGPLLIILPSLVTGIQLVGIALAAITGPVGIATMAILAIIATIVYWIKNWDMLKRNMIETWEDLKNFFSGIWQKIKDIFGSAIDWIIDKINSFISAIERVVSAASSIGGTVKSIGSKITGLFGGGKALGGMVQAGTSYLVGERGPELFTPNQGGRIIPNNRIGGQVIINITGNTLLDEDAGQKISNMIMDRLRLNTKLAL